jgi:hypothetical protein
LTFLQPEGTLNNLFDWLDVHSGFVVAMATVVLVLVTIVYVGLTARMAREAAEEAKATNRLAKEMTEDRELSVRPFLVCIEAGRVSAIRADGVTYKAPAVAIRNIGNGPAINVVLWARYHGKNFQAHGITLAVGEVRPSDLDPTNLQTLEYVEDARDDYDPSDAIVGDADEADLSAYCNDIAGTRLRFNLRRSVDPPEVWRRDEEPPAWAQAWSASGADG